MPECNETFSSDLMKCLLASENLLVIVRDSSGIVRYASPSCLALAELAQETLIGSPPPAALGLPVKGRANGIRRFDWHEFAIGETYRISIGTAAQTERARTMEAYLDDLPGIAFAKDRMRRITYLSAGFDRVFGYSREAAIGRRDEDYLPRAVAKRIKAIEASILATGKPHTTIESDEAVEGSGRRWMIHRFAIGDGEQRTLGGLSMEITDVTLADDVFRATAEAGRDGVGILRARRDARGKVAGFDWMYANASCEAVVGKSGELLLGQDFASCLPSSQAPRIVKGFQRVMETGDPFRTSLLLHPKGESLHIHLSAVRAGDYLSVEFADVTLAEQQSQQIVSQLAELEALNDLLVEQKLALEEHARRLELLSTTDGLTGLLNHRRFQEVLDTCIDQADRYGTPLSLAMIDVDHFKRFNDDFGHRMGDSVLRNVAAALLSGTRNSDIVARYGGEEFALVMPLTSCEDALLLCDRLRRTIETLPHETLRPITISVGVANYAAKGQTKEALIEQADRALYAAKRTGRNRVASESVVAI